MDRTKGNSEGSAKGVLGRMVVAWVERQAYKSVGTRCTRQFHQPVVPQALKGHQSQNHLISKG